MEGHSNGIGNEPEQTLGLTEAKVLNHRKPNLIIKQEPGYPQGKKKSFPILKKKVRTWQMDSVSQSYHAPVRIFFNHSQ